MLTVTAQGTLQNNKTHGSKSTYICTGGNELVQTGKEKQENPSKEKTEPSRQKTTPIDNNDIPYVYCMECEDLSIENQSENYMPIDDKSDEESKS